MLPAGTIEALGLFAVRTSVLVMASPLFGVTTSFAGAKIGLIAVLTLVLYSAIGAPLAGPPSPLEWGVLAVREALIGYSIAFVMQGVLLAVRVAGEMVGHDMGFNMGALVDPETGVNSPLITQFYEGLFLVGMLAVDGHHLIVRALADSFVQAPVGVLASTASLAGLAETLVCEMFNAGIVFALPVLVLMTIVSILIALIARAVPQINIMDVGFTLRILVGLIAMYAFAPLLAPAMERLYGALAFGLERVLVAAGS
ncbi:MAG: flagellar biosynthetic protein FliR [Planctomycetes bacterium]|nr:flagellar biosynthetic protein FliR [Planctomycetota bacterium]